MSIDFQSHPSEHAPAGQVGEQNVVGHEVGVSELRKAIPSHCFQSSYVKSLGYLFRDAFQAAALMVGAYRYIPFIEDYWLRFAAWALYGYIEGLAFVGLWVLGHECGHSAFSPSEMLNHTVGFILHSSMMTPYFSWRSTHRRHHIYANNLQKDHNYVPPRREEYALSLRVSVKDLEEMVEDAPIVTFLRIMVQQIFGFPMYLGNNITAAEDSLPKPKSSIPLGNSHFAPWGSLFRKDEALFILMSDIGLLGMAYVLYMAGSYFGIANVALLYLQPYVWVNHWIVAITYMHHTHPDLPKFENDAWTFLKGATATVDRKFDWFGKHFIHNIVDFHVIHHLFPKIPHYHAEEATRAIRPLLGKAYHEDKQRMFLPSIWESFTKCQWVEAENLNAAAKDRVMKYRGGPSPPPETAMGIKGLFRQARSVSSGIYAKW